MKMKRITGSAVVTIFAFSMGIMTAQVASNQANLSYQGLISIPNWTTTGATAESVDLSSFDPVTSILYYADHVAHAVIAIDTKTNSFVGWVPIPNCTGSCPSGVQVAPNIRKLIVNDKDAAVLDDRFLHGKYLRPIHQPWRAVAEACLPAAVPAPAWLDPRLDPGP